MTSSSRSPLRRHLFASTLTLAAGFVSATVLQGAFPSVAVAQSDARPVIRLGFEQIVTSGALTPLREQSNVGTRFLPMVYAPLIELDLQGDLSRRPGLAESWRRLDDRTVELRLRKGARFHNGDEVKADDVAFSFGPERMFGKTRARGKGEATTRLRVR